MVKRNERKKGNSINQANEYDTYLLIIIDLMNQKRTKSKDNWLVGLVEFRMKPNENQKRKKESKEKKEMRS